MAYNVDVLQNTTGYITDFVVNLPLVLDHGLRCPETTSIDPRFVQLHAPNVIRALNTRKFALPGDQMIGRFVHARYTTKTPYAYMLSSGHNCKAVKNDDLLHFKLPLVTVLRHSSLIFYADRSPLRHDVEVSRDIADIEKVNASALIEGNFRDGRGHLFDAGFHVLGNIPLVCVKEIIVHSDAARTHVSASLAAARLTIPAVVDVNAYFAQ